MLGHTRKTGIETPGVPAADQPGDLVVAVFTEGLAAPPKILRITEAWPGTPKLQVGAGATRLVRYGNYPVRMHELEREFGRRCELLHLFLSREDAKAVATALNAEDV